MKALSHIDERRIEIIEVPDPEPEYGRVVVSLRTSGICGSDLHLYRRKPDLQRLSPAIRGHEPAGIVSSVGEGVDHLKEGDRVAVYHYESCGHCRECRQGNWMWCRVRKNRVMGFDRPGSMAEKMLVDARNCFLLPDELSFADGSFIACGAGTTWSALKKVEPQSTDVAVVFGCGPIGLIGIRYLHAMGTRVIAVGRRARRLETARQMGAETVIDIDTTEDVLSEIMSKYPNGVSLAYETSGATTAQQWMIGVLGRLGRAAVVGLGAKTPAINTTQIYGKQLTLRGSFVMNAGEYDNLRDFLVMNDIHLDALVSHRFPLDKAQQALELADKGDCTKVMLEMSV